MIRVTNIQRMCFDDGPGIRTTVFLKGCSIHCPWCCNPENISFEKHGKYGIDYSAGELEDILMKDSVFWGRDGGITFSGGEALMQATQLKELWDSLKTKGVDLAVETALFVPVENVKLTLPYIDHYYVDVKMLVSRDSLSVLGGDPIQYMNNVRLLSDHGCDICFRLPCSKEYVLGEENLNLICDFLEKYNRYPVEIFALHRLGQKKYEDLDLNMPGMETVSQEELQILRTRFRKLGCDARIIEI